MFLPNLMAIHLIVVETFCIKLYFFNLIVAKEHTVTNYIFCHVSKKIKKKCVRVVWI